MAAVVHVHVVHVRVVHVRVIHDGRVCSLGSRLCSVFGMASSGGGGGAFGRQLGRQLLIVTVGARDGFGSRRVRFYS